MAQQQGVSGISIDGDVVAGQQYIPRAQSMLRRLAERVEIGGVTTASDFVRLADNAYCYAIVASGLQRAVIVVDAAQAPAPSGPQRRFPVRVPDFYSGCVVDGTLHTPPKDIHGNQAPDYLGAFWPTPACAALFKISPDEQQSTKLNVTPFGDIDNGLDSPNEFERFSQYVVLKPTMYSGRMRQVVQFLMGYGRQEKRSLYDRTPPKLTSPKESRTPPTAYQSDIAKNGVQIRYDWRWYRTHGIGVGHDNTLWLVEIGNTRGAIAMQLPMNADTALPAFRTKLEKMGDSAGLAVLDEFGAFPTGEAIPGEALESWIRAGKILRLSTVEDLQEFYDLNTFSSSMGWAFNRDGNEAHNVANGTADSGIKFSSHFGFSFTIGALHNITPPASAAAAKAAISKKSKDERYAAVIFKIDRMAESDLSFILAGSIDADDLFEALDAATVPPMATADGNLWLETSGPLYKLGRTSQYNLKFPSPELGYLVSFDMRPVGNARAVHCDTDVHVFYVGNELKIVRFFNDPRSAVPAAVSDDSDGCQLVGKFTRTVQAGSLSIPTCVYSADFDDRREVVGNRSVTLTSGVDIGYCSISVVDDITDPVFGNATRQKRFKRNIDTQAWSGEGVDSVMVVPFGDRCAYYYCVNKSQATYSHSNSWNYRQQLDPWSCPTWRNFPGYSGHTSISGAYIRDQHPDGCGPVDARTAMSPSPVFTDRPCGEFADTGPWCFVCTNIDALLYSIPVPPTPAGFSLTEGFKVVRTSYLVNEDDITPLLIATETFTNVFGGFENPWFIMSPDPDTNDTQYADVTHNVLGDGDAMRYWNKPNGGPLTIGGPEPPSMHNAATFIGVVP